MSSIRMFSQADSSKFYSVEELSSLIQVLANQNNKQNKQ